MIILSKREKRTLLTCDLELYRRATTQGHDAFYMEGQSTCEKLAELAERFNLELKVSVAESRCPKCNTQVRTVPKGEIVGRVKQNTFAHYKDYWECPKCEQVYWQGAHWTKIKKTLEKAREELAKSTNSTITTRRIHWSNA